MSSFDDMVEQLRGRLFASSSPETQAMLIEKMPKSERQKYEQSADDFIQGEFGKAYTVLIESSILACKAAMTIQSIPPEFLTDENVADIGRVQVIVEELQNRLEDIG